MPNGVGFVNLAYFSTCTASYPQIIDTYPQKGCLDRQRESLDSPKYGVGALILAGSIHKQRAWLAQNGLRIGDENIEESPGGGEEFAHVPDQKR